MGHRKLIDNDNVRIYDEDYESETTDSDWECPGSLHFHVIIDPFFNC
jgi:hypothetical protein